MTMTRKRASIPDGVSPGKRLPISRAQPVISRRSSRIAERQARIEKYATGRSDGRSCNIGKKESDEPAQTNHGYKSHRKNRARNKIHSEDPSGIVMPPSPLCEGGSPFPQQKNQHFSRKSIALSEIKSRN